MSELKNEISCLKAEIVELKAALDLTNKKLDSATASTDSMQDFTWNITENGCGQERETEAGQWKQWVYLFPPSDF